MLLGSAALDRLQCAVLAIIMLALLSCLSVVLKILAHAERKSEYLLALWLTGSNACEDAFSQLGGFGRLLAMVRDFSFGGALERLGHLAVLEAYKVTGEDPLRFGKHRGHKVGTRLWRASSGEEL